MDSIADQFVMGKAAQGGHIDQGFFYRWVAYGLHWCSN
jgi:hypothetical protein